MLKGLRCGCDSESGPDVARGGIHCVNPNVASPCQRGIDVVSDAFGGRRSAINVPTLVHEKSPGVATHHRRDGRTRVLCVTGESTLEIVQSRSEMRWPTQIRRRAGSVSCRLDVK